MERPPGFECGGAVPLIGWGRVRHCAPPTGFVACVTRRAPAALAQGQSLKLPPRSASSPPVRSIQTLNTEVEIQPETVLLTANASH